MRKFNAENERLKRRYEQYLREAKGQDEKSIDKVRAALVKFEGSTKFKPFKSFHIDQARQFKAALRRALCGLNLSVAWYFMWYCFWDTKRN